MRERRGVLLLAAALVAVVLVARVGAAVLAARRSGDATTPAAAQQTDAPEAEAYWLADFDATVYTGQGEPVQLSALAQGRPLVINFWATWCPYCVDELPDFQAIVADYGDRVSFAFVDVADGHRERAEDAATWLVEQGFDDLPAYYDKDLAAAGSFGASSLPTTVVVSAEGQILSVSAGRIDDALLRGALNTLV